MTDSTAFADKVVAEFKSVDDDHPIPPLYDALTPDLKLDLYIALGKAYKDRERAKKKSTAGAKTPKGASGKRTRDDEDPAGADPGSSFSDIPTSKRTRFGGPTGGNGDDGDEGDAPMQD